MSKIQNALKRIRDAKATRDPARIDNGETGAAEQEPARDPRDDTIATLAMREESIDATGEYRTHKVVEVDRDKLREAGLLAPEMQQRLLADQYRLIKRPLLDNAVGKNVGVIEDGNLIMVSSALSGDGKTFTCINLALSMASETDVSVLLVDADVPKPHISRIFGVSKEPGLIDLLVDPKLRVEDLLLPTDVPGLTLLPAGQHNDQATELLASKRMADLTQRLARKYQNRAVLFDSPPLLITPESRVLASHMGQIAMVVCAGRTPQQAAADAVGCIDSSKAINLILNQSSVAGLSGTEYGYGYGYGYGRTQSKDN
ncbi:MAG: XrtA-associated tyrosine autokinase [Pseudomonadota bacterium]